MPDQGLRRLRDAERSDPLRPLLSGPLAATPEWERVPPGEERLPSGEERLPACEARGEFQASQPYQGLATARVNPKLAPADSLKREIQAVLTDELAQEGYRSGHRRTFRWTPAGTSRRAQTIVERVRAARGG
jgi:hypothetical protein